MGQEFDGNRFIHIPVASGKHISLENATGVTFTCFEDGGAQAITIKESIDGASEANLAVVKHLYASDGVGSVFTRETTDANGDISAGDATIVKKDTTAFDAATFYIDASWLSAGFNCVEVSVDGGTCDAIVHMKVGRALQNQAVVVVA